MLSSLLFAAHCADPGPQKPRESNLSSFALRLSYSPRLCRCGFSNSFAPRSIHFLIKSSRRPYQFRSTSAIATFLSSQQLDTDIMSRQTGQIQIILEKNKRSSSEPKRQKLLSIVEYLPDERGNS